MKIRGQEDRGRAVKKQNGKSYPFRDSSSSHQSQSDFDFVGSILELLVTRLIYLRQKLHQQRIFHFLGSCWLSDGQLSIPREIEGFLLASSVNFKLNLIIYIKLHHVISFPFLYLDYIITRARGFVNPFLSTLYKNHCRSTLFVPAPFSFGGWSYHL